MNKSTIFMNAYKAALKNSDYNVLAEMDGFEDDKGNVSFRDTMHNMIRIQVQEFIGNTYEEKGLDFDEWLDDYSDAMYDDLWTWIDSGLKMDDTIFDDTDWVGDVFNE